MDNNNMKIIKEINYNNNLIIKVIGNQHKQSVLTENVQLLIQENKGNDIHYELVFKLLDNIRKNAAGVPLNDKKLNDKIFNFYKIDDTIEIISSSVNTLEANNLFVVKEKYYDTIANTTTLYLNTLNKDVNEINDDTTVTTNGKKEEVFITKFDLNEIIKEFYESQTQYNIDYLVTKNKIEKYGTIIDTIKETRENRLK